MGRRPETIQSYACWPHGATCNVHQKKLVEDLRWTKLRGTGVRNPVIPVREREGWRATLPLIIPVSSQDATVWPSVLSFLLLVHEICVLINATLLVLVYFYFL